LAHHRAAGTAQDEHKRVGVRPSHTGTSRRSLSRDAPARPPPRGRLQPNHPNPRSEEHTSELQSRFDLVCRLLLEKKKKTNNTKRHTHTDYALIGRRIHPPAPLTCAFPGHIPTHSRIPHNHQIESSE